MIELHLTKKDFNLVWFSGQGAGGQHRNKHQNCCRITHIETGLTAVGQRSRSRVENQDVAFRSLVKKVLAYYEAKETMPKQTSDEVIRNYNAERNEVKCKSSGYTELYTDVVVKGDLSNMIDARLKSVTKEV